MTVKNLKSNIPRKINSFIRYFHNVKIVNNDIENTSVKIWNLFMSKPLSKKNEIIKDVNTMLNELVEHYIIEAKK